MFSNFTQYMYYIYSLSFNGIPFYIGLTHDPVSRYKGHYYSDDCKTNNYVRYNLLHHNKYATMKIICCCDTKNRGLEIEAKCIQLLYLAGFNPLNKDWNYANLPLYPPIYHNLSNYRANG